MSKLSSFFIASPENNFRPQALSYKAFFIYGVLMLVLRLLLAVLPASGAAVESQTLMDLINTERALRNHNTLIVHPSLLTAASLKSQDMIDRDYFAHIDPDGNYVWPKILAAGYGQYKILGENLAVDFLTSEGMVKAWLDSPTHRANLLHTEFLEQGLSALYGDFQGRFTNLTASLFGARLFAASEPPAQPPPALLPPPPAEPEIKSELEPPAAPVSPPPAQPAPSPKPALPPGAPAVKTPPVAPLTAQPAIPPAQTLQPVGSQIQLPEFTVNTQAIRASRIVFTIFGLLLLGLLIIDTVIIMRHDQAILRSHSSNHFFGLMIFVLISILIWWW